MIESFFSHFCHQDPGRSFFVGGQVLPFCHRCAGLYTGAVVAALLFASFGLRQKRLMPAWLVVLNLLFILAMGFFGFPIIEQPPAVRYATGTLFGAAIVTLAWPLVLPRWVGGERLAAWSGGDQLRYFVFLALGLNLPFFILWCDSRAVWWAWSVVGVAGLALALALPNLLVAQLLCRAAPDRPRVVAAVALMAALIAGELLLLRLV
jgi:uncharacterized membrane protein